MRLKRTVLLAVVIALCLAPLLLHDDYIYHMLIMAGIYAVLAAGLNLLTGCAGLFSLGHAAFYGLGAYFSALTTLRLNWPFLPAFLGSGLFAGCIGALIAFPALRLRGIFLAIGTMGFNEIFRLAAINFDALTGGPAGLPGIAGPELFGFALEQPRDFYLGSVLLCSLVYIMFSRILRSHSGRTLIAVRDDEIAAQAMGIHLTRVKVMVFALSSFSAGLAGSFFAHYMAYISPDNFGLAESFSILAMVALGGIGNLPGSVLGAALLIAGPEAFRFLQEYRLLIYGITLILVVRLLPGGILAWYPWLESRLAAGNRGSRPAGNSISG
jgi:branched-chain amino acid transport system permease protein